MSGHTPGPWGWVYEDESMQTLCGTDPDYPDRGPEPLTCHVLSVNPCRGCQRRTRESGEFHRCLGPNKDDARLIAAAPAMYKAIIERAKREAREYDDGEHEWRAYLTEAEADAIAMVEGEAKGVA